MNPDNFNAWVPIFRDFVIVLLATFILGYETVWTPDPNAYLIGAALTMLGAPAAMRVDQLRKRTNGKGDGNGD